MQSKADVNRLGQALRDGAVSPESLIALDEYRRSFQPAISEVVEQISRRLGSGAGGVQRPSKSTPSIVAKLCRQPTLKLTQIQDIAGMRMLLPDRPSQDWFVGALQGVFPQAKLVDRRLKPSYGYRAVHLVVLVQDRPVEIQVRTLLQQEWADLSENLADVKGHALKYGGGEGDLQRLLTQISEDIHQFEIAYSNSNFDQLIFEATEKQIGAQIDALYRAHMPGWQ